MKRKSLLLGLVILFTLSITTVAFAECWVALSLNNSKRKAAVATGPTLWDAQKKAMRIAGMPGAAIWAWAKGGYLAMAVDRNNPNTFGMDGGNTIEEAEQNAVAYCRKMGGRNCKVITKGGCGPVSQQGGPWKEQIKNKDLLKVRKELL